MDPILNFNSKMTERPKNFLDVFIVRSLVLLITSLITTIALKSNYQSINTRVSSRTVSSWEFLGRSLDKTGQDLKTLKVPGPKSLTTKVHH